MQTDYADLRAAIAKLCEKYNGQYWRKLDDESGYPEEFVTALTRDGWLSILIPEQYGCLLYTSPSPRDGLLSRMPSSA